MAYKGSSENFALANIKNRSQTSQLQTSLDKIEKEKQNELRMDNNEKLRFMAKYSKLMTAGDGSKIHQAADVKMYETHNPGFCFKRNGEHRVLPQTMPTGISFDFEHLKLLLFTDGEVDIEKVLCLYLLSTHETEHLTPPSNKQKSLDRFTSNKKNSPMEQLIERSKNKNAVTIVSSTSLPIYVLDIKAPEMNQVDENFYKKVDNRLVARLLINEKILGLITTVMTALEDSNPGKMAVLQEKAQDVDALREILMKPHIQAFMTMLKGHALVCCCSSFTLSQPFKIKPIRLNVAEISEHLNRLVKYIHGSVLQLPTKAYLKRMYENSKIPETIEESPPTERRRSEKGSPRSAVKVLAENTEPNDLEGSTRKDFGRSSSTSQQLLEGSSKLRHSRVNFVTKNIKDVAEKEKDVPKQPYQELQRARRESNESKRNSSRKKSIGSARRRSSSSSSSSSAEPSRQLSELTPTAMITGTTNKGQSVQLQHNHDLGDDEIKVHSKQTTCAACMEKWKIPLPAPKTSKLNRSVEAVWLEISGSKEDVIEPETKLKTNHERRLMNLIEQEEYRLDSYDRKYAKYSSSSSLSHSKPKRQANKDSDEFAEFNVYDLEKIKLVIREKEAQKKLQNFLAIPGNDQEAGS